MPNSGEEDGPHNGHLGTTWEIVIVTVFVVLIFIIIGTVIFQIRRKQRMRREEQEMLDAEAGTRTGTGEKITPSEAVEPRLSDKAASLSVKPKRPASSHRHSTTPSSSSSHPDHPSKKPPRYYWDHR